MTRFALAVATVLSLAAGHAAANDGSNVLNVSAMVPHRCLLQQVDVTPASQAAATQVLSGQMRCTQGTSAAVSATFGPVDSDKGRLAARMQLALEAATASAETAQAQAGQDRFATAIRPLAQTGASQHASAVMVTLTYSP